MGVNYETYREKYEPKLKYPFSSARKRMSVISEFKGESHIFVKGASEMVLATCDFWYNMDKN
jgi:magnesium-transporting ATPase (P-type)